MFTIRGEKSFHGTKAVSFTQHFDSWKAANDKCKELNESFPDMYFLVEYNHKDIKDDSRQFNVREKSSLDPLLATFISFPGSGPPTRADDDDHVYDATVADKSAFA